jgi:hypothetical protein
MTATAKLIVFCWSFPLDFFNWGGAENDEGSEVFGRPEGVHSQVGI